MLYNRGIKAGAYDKVSTACDGCVSLFGGKNRTCTDEHIGIVLRDSLDCVGSSCCAEGDFSRGKTAVDKSLGKGYCVLCVVNLDNGNNTCFVNSLINVFHCLLLLICML